MQCINGHNNHKLSIYSGGDRDTEPRSSRRRGVSTSAPVTSLAEHSTLYS